MRTKRKTIIHKIAKTEVKVYHPKETVVVRDAVVVVEDPKVVSWLCQPMTFPRWWVMLWFVAAAVFLSL